MNFGLNIDGLGGGGTAVVAYPLTLPGKATGFWHNCTLTSGGGLVTRSTDAFGNGNDAVSAGSPPTLGTINGVGVPVFHAGSSQTLNMAAQAALNATTFTLYCAATSTNVNAILGPVGRYAGGDVRGAGLEIFPPAAGSLARGFVGTALVDGSGVDATVNPVQMAIVVDGLAGTFALYVSGALIGTSAADGYTPTPTDFWSLGAWQGGGTFHSGAVIDCSFYGAKHTLGQIAGYRTWLKTKFASLQ